MQEGWEEAFTSKRGTQERPGELVSFQQRGKRGNKVGRELGKDLPCSSVEEGKSENEEVAPVLGDGVGRWDSKP